MTVILVNIIGWIGVLILLIDYALVSLKKVEGDSLVYQTLNIIGALMLILNSSFFGAYPSVGVNIAWVGIAVFTVLTATLKKKRSSLQ